MYPPSIRKIGIHTTQQAKKQRETYRSNPEAVLGYDGHVGAALAVEGRGGGGGEWHLVRGDGCNAVTDGLAGCDGVGAWLDGATLG